MSVSAMLIRFRLDIQNAPDGKDVGLANISDDVDCGAVLDRRLVVAVVRGNAASTSSLEVLISSVALTDLAFHSKLGKQDLAAVRPVLATSIHRFFVSLQNHNPPFYLQFHFQVKPMNSAAAAAQFSNMMDVLGKDARKTPTDSEKQVNPSLAFCFFPFCLCFHDHFLNMFVIISCSSSQVLVLVRMSILGFLCFFFVPLLPAVGGGWTRKPRDALHPGLGGLHFAGYDCSDSFIACRR